MRRLGSRCAIAVLVVACSSKPPAGDGPTLVSHTPTEAAMNVGVDLSITLTFSRAMEPGMTPVALTPSATLSSAQWSEDGLTATLTTSAPLAFATRYTAQVSGTGKDAAPLQSASFTFTTRTSPDPTPPTLTTTVPVQLQQNVGLGTSLVLVFSEGMDPATLSVISNPDRDWGTPSWAPGAQSVTFSMAPATLMPDTTYTVTVDCQDASGNALTGSRTIVFTSAGPPDTAAPTVVSISPTAAATGVAPNANISISFSEAMKPSAAQALSVSPTVTGLACALDGTATLMTCSHPATPFTASTPYTLTLRGGPDGGTVDLAGNPLAADLVSMFTTGTVADTTAPTVVSYSPDSGVLGMPYKPAMTVTFSEPMDKLSVQQSMLVTQPAFVANNGAFAWNPAGTSVTFTPSVGTLGLDAGTVVDWQVGTGAKDLSGNGLAMPQQYTMRVRRHQWFTIDGGYADGTVHRPYSGADQAWDNQNWLTVERTTSYGEWRSFVYFDLADVPSYLGIYEAQLQLYQAFSNPTPGAFTNGRVIGEMVTWDTPPLGVASFDAAVLPTCPAAGCPPQNFFVVSNTAGTGPRVGTATYWVQNALSSRTGPQHAMFRLTYAAVNSMIALPDCDVVFASYEWSTPSQRPKLVITYEVP